MPTQRMPKLLKILLTIAAAFILLGCLIISSEFKFQCNGWLYLLIFLLCFIICLNYFLKQLFEKPAEAPQHNHTAAKTHDWGKFGLFVFGISSLYALIASLLLIPAANAVFALYTQRYGTDETALMYGEVHAPAFTLSKKPCIRRLKFPESTWSSFSYVCMDNLHSSRTPDGIYRLTLRRSLFGANIQRVQYVHDALSAEQRRMLTHPQVQALLNTYAEMERKFGPPINAEDGVPAHLIRPASEESKK